MTRELVFGAQYFRPPNPPRSDWQRDLRRMREVGFDTVKLWACWSWMAGTPGRVDHAELDELLDLAHAAGLRVVVNTILENAPYWLAQAHPEARYVDHEGRPVDLTAAMNTPGGGWPGLCFHHAVVRDASGAFLDALVERHRSHPALFVWDVWNEPHLEPASYFPERQYCYCGASVAAFRRWLVRRYERLGALNEAWARRYSSWDEVEPPRLFEAIPDLLDWRRFWFEQLEAWLGWRADRVRRLDPDHPTMTHVALSGYSGQLATHTLDEFTLAGQTELYGTSSFPTWLMGDDHVEHLFTLDTARDAAAGRPFWQAELQGGRGRRNGAASTPQPTPARVGSWMWNAIASGARGVLFWQWRPELLGPESPGYGLCTPSGELTDRARAAGALAASLRDRPELEDTEPASAPVGLLLSQDTALLTWGTDRSGHLYTDAVAGAYRLLADAGIPVQLLTAARVAADGVPDSVEALWWPMPLVCGDALAAALARFVGRGGRLVAEAGAGQYDECGWCRPGHPTGILRELFGVEVADGDVVDDPTVELPDGTAVRGAWQVETLLPVGPARALLVPTYPSLGYERRRDPETREAMVRLLGPPALGWAWDEPRPGLVARLLLRDGRPHAVVGVNHTDRPARLTVGDTTELVRPLSGAILSVAARLAGFL